MKLLTLGGSLSAGVGLLHVAIIAAGAPAYRYFGAGERMARQAARGSLEPALLTSAITIVFFVWAACALSAAGLLRPLPRVRTAVLVIGLIYTLRGLALPVQAWLFFRHGEQAVAVRHLVFSAVSLLIGLLHLAGLAQAGSSRSGAAGR